MPQDPDPDPVPVQTTVQTSGVTVGTYAAPGIPIGTPLGPGQVTANGALFNAVEILFTLPDGHREGPIIITRTHVTKIYKNGATVGEELKGTDDDTDDDEQLTPINGFVSSFDNPGLLGAHSQPIGTMIITKTNFTEMMIIIPEPAVIVHWHTTTSAVSDGAGGWLVIPGQEGEIGEGHIPL